MTDLGFSVFCWEMEEVMMTWTNSKENNDEPRQAQTIMIPKH